MKILGIEHVAIATESLKETASFWGDILGILHTGEEEVESEEVTTHIYDTGRGKIELLTHTGDTSPVARFLEARGPGIHHICLEVDDIESAMDSLKQKGVRLVYQAPRQGAEGHRVAFIHPRSAGGVLVELCQKS